MWYIANVGPVPFRYAGAVYAPIPPLDNLQSIPVSGEEMHVLREKDRSFLVVDHRASPGAMARIEFWPTAAPTEGGLDGLFVLSDAQGSNTSVTSALALSAIADLFPRDGFACREPEPLAVACR